MRRLIPLLLLGFVGCASGPQAYIPVDSPLRQWAPPEGDEYAPEPTAPATPPPAAEKASKDKKK